MTILEAYSRFKHLRGNWQPMDVVSVQVSTQSGGWIDAREVMMVAAVCLAGNIATAENDEDLLELARWYFVHLHGKTYNNFDLEVECNKVVTLLECWYGIDLGAEHGAG